MVWVRLVLVVGAGGCRHDVGGREAAPPKLAPTRNTPFSLFFIPLKEEGRKEGLLKSCFPSCWESST